MVMPLMFFATFAGGFGALGDLGGFGADSPANYSSFQFVFVWLQGSAFQGMFSGFGIARDYESGFARRLMLAAPNRNGILAGYLLATLLRSIDRRARSSSRSDASPARSSTAASSTSRCSWRQGSR